MWCGLMGKVEGVVLALFIHVWYTCNIAKEEKEG